MNLPDPKIQFYPQHTNKCYCQNGNFCCCPGRKQSPKRSTSSHKFIKVQSSDKNKSKSSLFRGSNSFSTSSAPTLITSVSTLSSLHGVSSSEPRHTEMRDLYERSKGLLNHTVDVRVLGMAQQPGQNPSEPDWFSDDQIAELQEFRLRNADECLSISSRYTMVDKVYRSKDSSGFDEVINEKYTLNKRGLLESYNDRYLPITKKRAAVAIVADSKAAARDILRQKLRTSKEKEKFLRKALCVPDNSLALRYQKTY